MLKFIFNPRRELPRDYITEKFKMGNQTFAIRFGHTVRQRKQNSASKGRNSRNAEDKILHCGKSNVLTPS